MSRISFENYGRLANTDNPSTVISGRYTIQFAAEKRVPIDVFRKLELMPIDRLLEIGCGIGNLAIPLSFFVHNVTGIDHPETIKRLKQRFSGEEIRGLAGNFLDMEVNGKFSKILSYSVIHTLSDEEEVLQFIAKALELLELGGRMLIGDVPNLDLKRRFLSTPEGKDFLKEWEEKMKSSCEPDLDLPIDHITVKMDDDFIARIVSHFNTNKLNCSVLEQPINLPFGHTRQDILIQSLR